MIQRSLFWNEPTAGLDPNERIRFRNILSELSEDRIVILSTHIVSDVQSIAGQVILLKEGKVISYDTTENLRRLVEGKVWLATVTHRELNELKKRFPIGNVLQKDDHFEIRIVSDSKPLQNATAVDLPWKMCLYTCWRPARMSLVVVEFKKIISKRYVWVLTLLLALFYAYLILNIADNFSVVYSKRALQPVFQEIMDAAYDPQVQEYVIKMNLTLLLTSYSRLFRPE